MSLSAIIRPRSSLLTATFKMRSSVLCGEYTYIFKVGGGTKVAATNFSLICENKVRLNYFSEMCNAAKTRVIP